jgi:elongation factor P
MPTALELRPGTVVRLDGELYRVLAAESHAGGGKMGGVTHAKLRSVRTGTPREWRFRLDQAIDLVELERRPMQYLYSEGSISYFMHPETFEQVALDAESLGAAARWLTEGLTLPVEFCEGRPVSVAFPDVVEATVAETAEPSHAQGVDNVWKQARLDNRVEVLVPPFIAQGERIRVDVHAGRYLERAKAGRHA